MVTRLKCWMLVLVLLLVGTAHAEQVVYYSFDGIAGDTVDDLSGSGNHGTLEDGPAVIEGQIGEALAFDSSRVTVPPSDSLTADLFQGSFTVVAWINPTRTGNTWQQVFRAVGTNGANDTLFLNNDGRLSWRGRVNGAWAGGMCETAPDVVPADQWTHAAVVGDGTTFRVYVNGVLAQESAFQTTDGVNTDFYVGGTAGGESYAGAVDEFAIFTEALSDADILAAMSGLGKKGIASKPNPEDESADILRDTVLSWASGKYAQKHNIYLGSVFADVNDADVANPLGVLASEAQDANSYDAGIFEFGQTYFWRVDEVNGAPDNTIYKGEVWSFTVEPFSIPIESVTATASSAHSDGMQPEKTIDGSGLNELDQHVTEATTMWLSGMGDTAPSLQYEFDKAYNLDQLLVWNSNQLIEAFVGLGAKDVVIEFSLDGAEWTVLEGATLLNQATGSADYTANTSIDFAGAMAQHVRITINAGYGMLPQYGISEVRFMYIPTFAREPQPADGDITDAANVMLSWRAGREAMSHQVNLGTDAENLDLVGTTAEPSYAANGLNYGTTYFWSITEVNEAEAVTSHAGDIWSFTTPNFGIVDGFDLYDDNCERIFFAWEDGLGHNGGTDIDDCDVPPSNGNGGGSIVGNAQAPFAEQAIVHAGSRQSMPLEYDNAFGASEATLTIGGQDWTASGVQTLSLQFYGQAGNTGELYVKINNSKVSYDGEAADIAKAQWLPWNIDLTALTGLQNVTSLTIGVDGGNAAGMLYIDSIRLYPQAREFINPADPGALNLVALYDFEGDFTDSVGGHNGTELGLPQITSDPGRGQVLSLAGADAWDVPYSAALNPTEFSASLWALVNPNGSGHRSPITSRDDGPQAGYIIYVEPGNAWQFWTGPGWDAITGPQAVMDEWTHVGITFANDQKQLYVNGRLAAEGTAAMNLNTAQPLRIGGGATEDPNGQFFFVGLIDEVRIYNQALTPEEMAWLADIRTPMHKSL